MEADKVTEEPHSTMDTEEHPSSKDGSAEESQEPLIPETPFEPSISETPLEPHTSESYMVPPASQALLETHASETSLKPSISQTPLEAHTSESHMIPSTSQAPVETHTSKTSLKTSIPETPLEVHTSESPMVPSTSQAPLETYTSETLLEPSISETPVGNSENPLETPMPETLLETLIFKDPEKRVFSHTSSQDHVPVSSPDTLEEDLFKYSPNEVLWRRKSSQISEYESLQKHSLSSPSAPVHLDTSAKEEEEEGEDKKPEEATDSSAHTAHPGQQPGKKKAKKGFSHYTAHPVVPAKQTELVEVAKARPREKFGAQMNYLFQWEKNAALSAIQTGLYIGWRCPHYLWDCFRIGDESKCFCGHLLKEHQIISDISVPCNVGQCRCLMFCFIPSRPEEVGEFWLKRRATFDPKAWRAQCRCKHSHEEHTATGSHPCRVKGCCCNCFESNFLCAACDRRWEEHETFFETEETRRRGGRPRGADYMPFAEMPTFQEAIVSNSDSEALQKQGPSGHPGSHCRPPGPPGPHSFWPDPMSDPHT
ncbi:protein FAM221B isoform X4 [Mustela erminea]|uniref:protein FAM221B isoform X2 n=1 Tax=Mustela erminea TaxID=36723 RepID=UPI001387517D|nr:protein FAM221B isoform X2 [Mustela erminea]XP_032163274.1 protein FAM221B isoform X3 [Mustela erminea]XP_032163275.1 protein FAM221B isoform X4 [Mustela erminea]